ncbi:SAM-dependent methyltransferase [Paenibacillus sp. y28]|uniref:SAM-dependent methyltransferase n=1 Tax=Paenibacillus sp. y28 TaxID=3129110 RepID=UPI00301A5022
MAESNLTVGAGHPVFSRFIVTSNRGSHRYAQDELRKLCPGVTFTELEPEEVQLAVFPRAAEEVLAAVRENEPVFIRHLHPVTAILDMPSSPLSGIEGNSEPDNGQEQEEEEQASAEQTVLLAEQIFAQVEAGIAANVKAAVQLRKSSGVEPAVPLGGLREALEQLLMQHQGAQIAVQEAEAVISVFITQTQLYTGCSRTADNLSDWAGGAVRFRREEGQVSRAKFKLLEAESRFGLDFSLVHKALDIGAAPGGWTSLLLERGAQVTAVDPGELHPSLRRHPKLTMLRKNAADVRFRDNEFDLLVCDMSWSPKQMVRLVRELLYALCPGGTAIITLKLMHGKPFQTLKDAIRAFSPLLEFAHAKQLFHNRDELTLHMVRTGEQAQE